MFAVFGSGFGLYGYVPAIVDVLRMPVALPERYRPVIEGRRELRHLASAVHWFQDHEQALRRCDAAVIAVPPHAQGRLVQQCLAHGHVRRLVLEKPIAPDPAAGVAVLDSLAQRGVRYAIGYTLAQCAWVPQLTRLEGLSAMRIDWHFMAHHFARGMECWKRDDAAGGGSLHFYGTHLLALLARVGYGRVTSSLRHGTRPGQSERWEAIIEGEGKPTCTVCVDSRSDRSGFIITGITRAGSREQIVSLSEPFAMEPAIGLHDRRIAAVAAVIRNLDADWTPLEAAYRRASVLWLEAAREG